MKLLLTIGLLLLLNVMPANAQTVATVSASPPVLGLYDEELSDRSTTGSASAAEVEIISTPAARTSRQLDPTNAPISGTLETSLFILIAGISFILLGIRVSR